MKKIKRILLAVTFILCSMMTFACGKRSGEDGITYYGNVAYIHYPDDNMITANGHTYRYEIIGEGYEYEISITYPDEKEVKVHVEGSVNSIGGHLYAGEKYAYPEDLADIIISYKEANDDPVQVPLIIGGVVTFIIGVVMVGAPELGFKLRYWEVENAEQSETSKGVSIAFGIIFMIAGVIMALVGIF